MDRFVDFALRIEKQLADASRLPTWTEGDADRYMQGIADRRKRFERLANGLMEEVIHPRLALLTEYFSNASLKVDGPTDGCTCIFGYCDRFPASTKLAFSITHDRPCKTLAVRYDVLMTPTFTKFDEHDKHTSSLEAVSTDDVADWVERRTLEFLTAYLQTDRGGEEFDDEVAVDPVCGMRISRGSAAASSIYRGHPYFFCSPDCCDSFAQRPTGFARVKTM